MKDEAINPLIKASDRKTIRDNSWYFILKTLSNFDNLRSDPRFQEILANHKKLYEENLKKYGDIEELLN
jgi:hypothetical protein